MFQLYRRVKNAYIMGGILGYFKLLHSLELDVAEIAEKHFSFTPEEIKIYGDMFPAKKKGLINKLLRR